jgi:hypothetical protein
VTFGRAPQRGPALEESASAAEVAPAMDTQTLLDAFDRLRAKDAMEEDN